MKILNENQLKEDWRYRGQENYLKNEKFIKAEFNLSDGDHTHCDFCWQKFGLNADDLQSGYCTQDRYHWVCEDCFNDFENIFNWTKIE